MVKSLRGGHSKNTFTLFCPLQQGSRSSLETCCQIFTSIPIGFWWITQLLFKISFLFCRYFQILHIKQIKSINYQSYISFSMNKIVKFNIFKQKSLYLQNIYSYWIHCLTFCMYFFCFKGTICWVFRYPLFLQILIEKDEYY